MSMFQETIRELNADELESVAAGSGFGAYNMMQTVFAAGGVVITQMGAQTVYQSVPSGCPGGSPGQAAVLCA